MVEGWDQTRILISFQRPVQHTNCYQARLQSLYIWQEFEDQSNEDFGILDLINHVRTSRSITWVLHDQSFEDMTILSYDWLFEAKQKLSMTGLLNQLNEDSGNQLYKEFTTNYFTIWQFHLMIDPLKFTWQN